MVQVDAIGVPNRHKLRKPFCNPFKSQIPQKALHYDVGIDVNIQYKTCYTNNRSITGSKEGRENGPGAWKAARSMSTVINQLRLSLTASRQKAVAQSDVQDDYPKSILIPENQRALAAQGFYTQHLGFKQKPGQSSNSETPKLTEEQLKSHTEAENNKFQDAAAKRKMFQKTHSKKWSLVKDRCEDENEDSSASFDYSRSMDFSTSNSMDSSDNPFSPDIHTSSISDLRRQIDLDITKKMEDAYFPFDINSCENVGISELRKHHVDRLSLDEDDGDYSVSPPISKQSTVERVKTLSSGSAQGGPVDHVKIVVSQDIDNENVFEGDGIKPEHKTELENMQYLSIGSVGSDRLSDTESSSDHTVVDKASSLDSPDIIENNQNHIKFPPSSSNQYHENVAEAKSVPDENDNLICFVRAPINQETPGSHYSPVHGEDLSRMGSLQSDSSGFGDAEYGADGTPHESELLKFSNPGSSGSSCESAATLASSVSTILSRDLDKHNSQFSLDEGDILSQMPTFSWQSGPSWKDEINEDLQSKPKQTYISTCYIPIAGKNFRQPYSMFHRPEIKAVDNHVSILVTNASVERSEARTCETRETVYKDSRLEPPVRESIFKELMSPSNSSIAANSDGYLSSPELGFGHSWKKTGYHRSQFSKSRFRYGSGDSILSESDYSYCSTPDSIASCNRGDMMDYHKLIKLINQPVNIQGYKRSIIQYKPKKHVKEWNNLLRKKRLQEETCMLQYAIQKYKTELHSLETAFMVQFQQAYEELSEEERDEVEELQHLWTAIHQQLLETERLLSQRLKKISSGNDFFTYISSLSVLQRMILLLREQLYQQQITVGKEDVEVVHQPAQLPLFKSQSCLGLNLPPPFTSSYHNPTLVPSRVGHSLEELRDSIIKDVREEIDKSTQNLHSDMKSKEEEIQRLQFELMVEKYRKEDNHNSVVETDV
ncbi:hypothetical protein LOTGIDRAFT_239454 [Lottia gigantea]|uniref:Sperm-specific antigen 2 C-terminal domain-containing protein n=1 Tax=Lottia gigantea TaxID=225164 RepID=V4ANL2_LOTGI|nr:hypothetical protein LOTGIDRAFT_239454 [Lottia gigantea]ESO95226.1 hypothetical protein LOTGIDRAFT_239454 [Lottia gigantea]